MTFVHFEFEPSDVQRLLPEPLVVDTFDGSAWVGLVAFEMQRVRLGPLPSLPTTQRFYETNVRTAVLAPDGTPGVYFFTLDATSGLAVLAARRRYRLPYQYARMVMQQWDDRIAYASRRRWPEPRGVTSRLVVDVGAAVAATPLDAFLTARWGIITADGRGRAHHIPVEHEAWALHEAAVVHLDDQLVAATGLPEPQGRMVLRYSPGVDVRIGRRRRC